VTALRLAVTGTDTGVGKTVVSCALVAALRARGLRVGAMKPVETGVDAPNDLTDAARLRRAAGHVDALEIVCPATYAEPLAPLVAAERSGHPVDVARLDAARAAIEHGRDALLVEGAGGLLVPFAPAVAFADLATRWSLDLVIVAANRLGVINHTLLTVREAERRGLAVRAVVLVAPQVDDLATRTNADALVSLLGAVRLVPFPRVRDPDDLDALAAAASPLAALLLETSR